MENAKQIVTFTVEAKVIRADGTEEELGVIATNTREISDG